MDYRGIQGLQGDTGTTWGYKDYTPVHYRGMQGQHGDKGTTRGNKDYRRIQGLQGI